jgi:acyl-CoA reductase-like NAD-dependent aldehyde dehydrogenase
MKVRSVDPSTGELLAEYEQSTFGEVRAAVERAKRGQEQWSSLPLEQRIVLMKEVGRVCAREKEDLAWLIHSECGFPKAAAIGAINSALAGIDYYSTEYRKKALEEPFPLDPRSWPGTSATIQYVPHGVVGHIGIWNFPFWQTMITAIPALLTGNSVVFKPSELSTAVGLRIAELIHEAGVPRDVYVPLIGGAGVGRELVTSDVDAIVFTGGIETGQDIIRNAGVKPLVLELSGNDPAIVCADATVHQAARGIAYGTFSRGGQVCVRVKRVYVHRDVAKAFLDQLVSVASRLDPVRDVGPLIREEAREEVDRRVRDAVSRGAKLLLGGRMDDGPGFFYGPTILLMERELEVMRTETFGPVCSVRIVDSEEEAVKLANDSPYGLGATVWTADFERGERLARQLEAGNVWINECVRTLPCGELFQGWKQSGIPSSQKRLDMFLKKRTIVSHRSCEPRGHWFG